MTSDGGVKPLQPSVSFKAGGSNVPSIETMDEYRLTCTDCTFSTVVTGDVDAVYDAIEAHQADWASGPGAHRVDFQLVGSH